MSRPGLLIVGLGNPLMADDGAGHEVVRRLGELSLPPGVRVAALDGDVLELASIWGGERCVWLIDAVSGSGPAGSLRVLSGDEVLGLSSEGASAHHPSLGESLRWMLHGHPEMEEVELRLYGIETGAVRPERGLSPEVGRAVISLSGEISGAVRAWLAQ